jgi:hypothetical protein
VVGEVGVVVGGGWWVVGVGCTAVARREWGRGGGGGGWGVGACRMRAWYDGARRRGGREAEGDGLLNRYTGLGLYRGFESPPLRFVQARAIAHGPACRSSSHRPTPGVAACVTAYTRSTRPVEQRAGWPSPPPTHTAGTARARPCPASGTAPGSGCTVGGPTARCRAGSGHLRHHTLKTRGNEALERTVPGTGGDTGRRDVASVWGTGSGFGVSPAFGDTVSIHLDSKVKRWRACTSFEARGVHCHS